MNEDEDREQMRRSTRHMNHDTNPHLDGVRLLHQRLGRWFLDGVRPRGATLSAAIENAEQLKRMPRWSDEQVETLMDLLRADGSSLADSMLADLEGSPSLVWLGGEQLDRGEPL